MLDLPTFLKAQNEISLRMNGQQRSPQATSSDLRLAASNADRNPQDIYAWVDVILAAIEGGLRSGTTPFALAQALTNRQNELGAKKWPPVLPHAPPLPKVGAQPATMDSEYGPETSA